MNRKLTVYGSMLCPDCVEAERILKERRIAHEFINITDSMANLKAFLAYRDSETIFAEGEGIRERVRELVMKL